MHHQAKRTRGLGSQHLRSDFSLFSLLQSSSHPIRLEWLQRSCDSHAGVLCERQSRVCSCCMQDNGLLSCRSAGRSAPGHNPPTSQHASSDGAPHLRSHACAASSACAEYGSATSYHMQQEVVSSTSLRPGSVLSRHRSHDWWVGVSCERFGGAGPSCMQDQGLISPRSNRRRPRGTTSRASRHLSSDFVQAGKV